MTESKVKFKKEPTLQLLRRSYILYPTPDRATVMTAEEWVMSQCYGKPMSFFATSKHNDEEYASIMIHFAENTHFGPKETMKRYDINDDKTVVVTLSDDRKVIMDGISRDQLKRMVEFESVNMLLVEITKMSCDMEDAEFEALSLKDYNLLQNVFNINFLDSQLSAHISQSTYGTLSF